MSIAYAQQGGRGTISGTVTDPNGGVVPDVQVSILNVDTGIAAPSRADSQGFFSSSSLIVGSYQVIAEKSGFKRAIRSGITLQVDQHAEVNIQLELGAVSQTVQVTASVPLVNTENASLGQVVGLERIEDLPVNGRAAFALVLLAPNVHSNAGPTASGFADRGTVLSDWSINGSPNALNSLLVDGMEATNSYYPDLNANLAVDAVQEFRVQSGTMSATYGFTLGGVINIATKSGTNVLHGSLYEFGRNNIFDARNTFTPTELPFRFNQYGFAVGGPFYIPKVYNGKNRTFFFGNFEEYRYIQHSSMITTVPTAAERTGDFSGLLSSTGALIPIYDPSTTEPNPSGTGYVRTQYPGNKITALDPVAQNINQFYPLPNWTPSNPYTNSDNYNGAIIYRMNMKQYTIRGDHRISDSDSLFARYTDFLNFQNNGNSGPWPNPVVEDRYDYFNTHNFMLSETHTFSPSLINEFSLGVARQHFPYRDASYGQNWTVKLGLPPSVPNVTMPEIENGLADFPNVGSDGFRGNLQYRVTDAVTLVRGSHTIKLGGQLRLLYGNNYQTGEPSGTFNFSSGLTNNPQAPSGTGNGYADFISGYVSNAEVQAYLGESEKGFSLSGFVQDDWRATRRLSLNLGLRYDYQQPPYEKNCGTSNFEPSTVNPLTGLLGSYGYACANYGKTFLDPDYKNFGPRIGFAYDLTGAGKTVVRGGYSIYYPSMFNLLFFGNTEGFANATTDYLPPGNNSNLPAFMLSQGFPTPVIQPLGRALGPNYRLSAGASYDQAKQATPMSQQWDFSVQKELPGNWVVEVSYSANHGTHLVAGSYDMNQLPDQDLSLGLALTNSVPNPYAGMVPGSLGGATISEAQLLKPYPYYSSISVRNPHLGNSIYHAGLVTVQKRFSQGLTVLASYTNGKLIDDSVAAAINFGNSIEHTGYYGYQDGLFNRRAERAIDPTDVSQHFVLSAVYQLPFGKGRPVNIDNRVVNGIVGGWQAETVTTLQAGLPVYITGANNNLASRPNITGSAKLDHPTAAEWFNTAVFVNPPLYTYGDVGRTLANVRNPGTFQMDVSLIKNTKIKERLTLQFRAEAFNMLNHVNLGYPDTGFSPGANGLNESGSFGVITSARNARSIQLALKLNF